MKQKNISKRVKVALVGSRDINDYQFVKETLFSVLKSEGLSIDEIELVSGGARGVDSIAQQIAKHYGIPITIIYPNYGKYGKRAPLIRNTEIVNRSDIVIAIPSEGSRGTWDTINKAKDRIKVYINRVVSHRDRQL